MTPTEFERHCGMASSKKWRFSIKMDPDNTSKTLGRWLDKQQMGYKAAKKPKPCISFGPPGDLATTSMITRRHSSDGGADGAALAGSTAAEGAGEALPATGPLAAATPARPSGPQHPPAQLPPLDDSLSPLPCLPAPGHPSSSARGPQRHLRVLVESVGYDSESAFDAKLTLARGPSSSLRPEGPGPAAAGGIGLSDPMATPLRVTIPTSAMRRANDEKLWLQSPPPKSAQRLLNDSNRFEDDTGLRIGADFQAKLPECQPKPEGPPQGAEADRCDQPGGSPLLFASYLTQKRFEYCVIGSSSR